MALSRFVLSRARRLVPVATTLFVSTTVWRASSLEAFESEPFPAHRASAESQQAALDSGTVADVDDPWLRPAASSSGPATWTR